MSQRVVVEIGPAPGFLRRVDPRLGLADDDFTALTTWATALD
ncbi:hypothetical protein [Streptomyces sp. NPDC048481]